MTIFLTLLQKLIPLYGIILIGFVAARRLPIDRQTIGTLLLYVISPLVFFNSVAQMPFDAHFLWLPASTFGLGTVISWTFYRLGGYLWQDSTKNILAFTAGTGNTGYFGIPVILILFGEPAVAYAVMGVIGYVLYENSVGYYLTARGQYSAAESLKRVTRLPALYAFLAGLLFSYWKIPIPPYVHDTLVFVRGSYSILGMLIIGIGLAKLKGAFDWKFLGATFFAKFGVWPAATALLTRLDQSIFHLYSPEIHRIMFVIASTPLAANTVVLATLLKAEPEKAAMAVLLSTLAALFLIPAYVAFFF